MISFGADVALHVVEPTVSGVHDLDRIVAATDFGVPSLVVVSLGETAKLQQFEELLTEHVDLDRLYQVLDLERRT